MAASRFEKEQPFVEHSIRLSSSSAEREEQIEDEDSLLWQRFQQKKQHGSRLWTIIHLSLMLTYTILFLGLVSWSRQAQQSEVAAPFSPAHQALEYRITVESSEPHDAESPFIGEPRLEMDEAWSELMYPTVIRVTEEEMKKSNKTSIGLLDGTGYVGNLEVYHQLHCVKRIKQLRHPEYYFPDVVGEELEHLHKHFDHCLEVLRHGILCRADTSLNTFEWMEENAEKPATIYKGERKCVNWERLHGWAKSKALTGGLAELYKYGEAGAQGPMFNSLDS